MTQSYSISHSSLLHGSTFQNFGVLEDGRTRQSLSFNHIKAMKNKTFYFKNTITTAHSSGTEPSNMVVLFLIGLMFGISCSLNQGVPIC